MTLQTRLRFFTAATILAICSSFTPAVNNSCHIHLYKQTTDGQWADLRSFDYAAGSQGILLDYDSYYTIRLTDMPDVQLLKKIPASIGKNGSFTIDLALALKESKSAENYFTEFPDAFVSCTQQVIGDRMIYTLLIKTKPGK